MVPHSHLAFYRGASLDISIQIYPAKYYREERETKQKQKRRRKLVLVTSAEEAEARNYIIGREAEEKETSNAKEGEQEAAEE